jgi:hypothetical protein
VSVHDWSTARPPFSSSAAGVAFSRRLVMGARVGLLRDIGSIALMARLPVSAGSSSRGWANIVVWAASAASTRRVLRGLASRGASG